MLTDFQRRGNAKANDGKLPTEAQRQILCQHLVFGGVIYARALCWSKEPEKAAAVLDAIHNLPNEIYTPSFRWSYTLMSLEIYYRRYPEDKEHWPNFLTHFDAAIAVRE